MTEMYWVLIGTLIIVIIPMFLCCMRRSKKYSMDDYMLDDHLYPKLHLDSMSDSYYTTDTDGDPYSTRGTRRSDFHLMRGGSIEKWTPREMSRHEKNLKHEMAHHAQRQLRFQQQKNDQSEGNSQHTLCVGASDFKVYE